MTSGLPTSDALAIRLRIQDLLFGLVRLRTDPSSYGRASSNSNLLASGVQEFARARVVTCDLLRARVSIEEHVHSANGVWAKRNCANALLHDQKPSPRGSRWGTTLVHDNAHVTLHAVPHVTLTLYVARHGSRRSTTKPSSKSCRSSRGPCPLLTNYCLDDPRDTRLCRLGTIAAEVRRPY